MKNFYVVDFQSSTAHDTPKKDAAFENIVKSAGFEHLEIVVSSINDMINGLLELKESNPNAKIIHLVIREQEN